MVRLSDILKKKMQSNPPSEEKKPAPSPEDSEATPQKDQTPEPTQQPQEMQIAKAMKEMQPDIERSRNLYSKGIQLSKEILNNAREKRPIDLNKIKDFVAEIVDALVLKDKELLSLFYEYTQENYLYSHIVNVSIMSVEVGLGLGYNKSKLNELSLAAFLHDIGMIKVENIALQTRTLSEEEYNMIKEHPLYGVEILSQMKDMPQAVIYVAKEVHERINGKGYPQGIKDGEISEYGRIIATVDVYEALTHQRNYRRKLLPHEAIKEILTTQGSFFEPGILRVLVSQIGIYPIGSWVELNTNEIGKVINANDELPLRPVINLIFDTSGNRLGEPRVVNLATQFNLFIKMPLSDEDISRKLKKDVR